MAVMSLKSRSIQCHNDIISRGGAASLGRLLFVLLVALAWQQEVRAIDCVDLVADCGAKADNSTDDTVAFAVCQTLASKHSGCITVPAGHYRIAEVELNISNIEIRVDNDAVFLLWNGNSHSVAALFAVGTASPVSADYVQNVSMHGQAPGTFTIDLSSALFDPWSVRGLAYFGGIKDFVLANMLCRMSDPQRNPNTKYRSENPCMAFNFETYEGERLNPRNGVLVNLSCVGCVYGYGLIQVHSAENVSAENLYSEGGVTFRLETGGTTGGYVGDIVGRNITCKDGQGAFFSQPHSQQNGAYHIDTVLSLGCNDVVSLNGGYSQHGLPPGHFSNSSSITNIVGVYGTQAQNSSLDVDVPSCAPCVSQNSPLNYKVTLTGIKAIGFPAPSNRTECIYYKRSQGGCPYSQ